MYKIIRICHSLVVASIQLATCVMYIYDYINVIIILLYIIDKTSYYNFCVQNNILFAFFTTLQLPPSGIMYLTFTAAAFGWLS